MYCWECMLFETPQDNWSASKNNDWLPCQRVPAPVHLGKTGSVGFAGPASVIGSLFTSCVLSIGELCTVSLGLSKQTVGEVGQGLFTALQCGTYTINRMFANEILFWRKVYLRECCESKSCVLEGCERVGRRSEADIYIIYVCTCTSMCTMANCVLHLLLLG